MMNIGQTPRLSRSGLSTSIGYSYGGQTCYVLEGKITSRGPKHERYVFQDATGSITVDIDDKLFAGRTVTPQNTVRLHGEVDVEHYGYREIDVKVLEIVK